MKVSIIPDSKFLALLSRIQKTTTSRTVQVSRIASWMSKMFVHWTMARLTIAMWRPKKSSQLIRATASTAQR